VRWSGYWINWAITDMPLSSGTSDFAEGKLSRSIRFVSIEHVNVRNNSKIVNNKWYFIVFMINLLGRGYKVVINEKKGDNNNEDKFDKVIDFFFLFYFKVTKYGSIKNIDLFFFLCETLVIMLS
jgi:hypothetical protein